MGRRLSFDIDEALDAAMAVFWEKGYEGSSLDDLTEAMGIGRPSLYNSFGNKEQLFRRVLRKYERERLGFAWRALQLPDVRLVIDAFVRGFISLATCPDAPRGCLGTHAAIAGSRETDAIRSLIVHRRDVYIAALTRRFRRARADDDLPANVDPRTLALYVITVVNGLALQAKYGLGKNNLEEVVSIAMSILPVAQLHG